MEDSATTAPGALTEAEKQPWETPVLFVLGDLNNVLAGIDEWDDGTNGQDELAS